MTSWQATWLSVFGFPPTRPASREESIQEVMAQLILGQSPACFLPYEPTDRGRALIRYLWRTAFGDGPHTDIDWLVSEYQLPVPMEWREDIRLTYGCPDFACAAGDQILIIELKTERGSYRARQAQDYLRLARRLHPSRQIDLILLAAHRPGDRPSCDALQRYAELTWQDLLPLLRATFGENHDAAKLSTFIDGSLTDARPRATPPAGELTARTDDKITTAIDQALHIAPAVKAGRRSHLAQCGIDVVFQTENDARAAESHIRQALRSAGHQGVTTWLWRRSSGGTATTPAGRDHGIEIRLAPGKAT